MDHSHLPAWIQAWGSITAILVSAIFAIGVPLYLRVVERREHVRTTLRSGLHAGAAILAGWQSVEDILATGKWGVSTRKVLGASSRYSQKLLDDLDDAALPDGGLTAIGAIRVSLAAYDAFLDRAELSFVLSSTLPTMNFVKQTEVIATATRELGDIAEPLKMKIAIG